MARLQRKPIPMPLPLPSPASFTTWLVSPKNRLSVNQRHNIPSASRKLPLKYSLKWNFSFWGYMTPDAFPLCSWRAQEQGEMSWHCLPALNISRLMIPETNTYLVDMIIRTLLPGTSILFKLNILLVPILCQQCARKILEMEQGTKRNFCPLSFW